MFSFSKKILSKLLSLLNNSLSTLKISGRNIYNHSAFTLTELIVVITILSILSVIGFVVMSHQSSVARDGKRISDIQTLSQSAKITSAQLRLLPTPIADSVSLTVSGTFIGYQGFMSLALVNPLGYGSDKIFDPKDNIPYTYRVNQHYDSAQFMAYLENPRFERNIEIAGVVNGGGFDGRLSRKGDDDDRNRGNQEVGMNGFGGLFDGVVSRAYALDTSNTDLTKRYPYAAGDKLGIFLRKDSNAPIQSGVNGTGSQSISTLDNSTLRVLVSEDTYLGSISTGALLSLKDGSFDEKVLLSMNSGTSGSGGSGSVGGSGNNSSSGYVLTMGEYDAGGSPYAYGYLGPLTAALFGGALTPNPAGDLTPKTIGGKNIDSLIIMEGQQYLILESGINIPSIVISEGSQSTSCVFAQTEGNIDIFACENISIVGPYTVGEMRSLGMVSGGVVPVVPTIPINLVLSPGDTEVTVGWNPVNTAISYTLAWSIGSGAYTEITGITGTGYIHTGLTNGSTYNYKVKAINASGESGYSSVVIGVPNASYNLIPGSYALTYSGTNVGTFNGYMGQTFIDLYTSYGYSVTPNPGGSVTPGIIDGKRIEAIIQIGNSIGIYLQSGSGNSQNITINNIVCPGNGVSAGLAGYVCATSPFGSPLVVGEQKSFTMVLGGIVPLPAPTVPTGLTLTPGDTDVTVGWNPVNTAISYTLAWNINGGAYTEITGITGTGYLHTGLTNGATYGYKIKAVNTNGESNYSSVVNIIPDVPPEVPTNFSATGIVANSMMLSWDAVQNGQASFTVEYSTNGVNFTDVGNFSGGGGTRQYSHNGLTGGTTYYYRIRATKSYGVVSAWSDVVSGVVLREAPTGLTARPPDPNETGIILDWNSFSGAISYTLAWSKEENGIYTEIQGITDISYTHTNLNTEDTYYYKIKAVTLNGESPYSNPVNGNVYSCFLFSPSIGQIDGNHCFGIANLVIPSKIHGVDVVTISGLQYQAGYTTQLTSVTIPDGVTTIGSFAGNNLTSVTIPNSVNYISDGAFKDNHLSSLVLGSGVVNIGNNAFENNQLTSVTIPDSVMTIGTRAFRNNQLTSVTLGNSLLSIGDSAFGDSAFGYSEHASNQLTSLVIPDSVVSIGDSAFAYNPISSLVLGSGVVSIGAGAFTYNQLTSVTIPNSVTSIGVAAFAYNQLTSVIIGNSVTSIGNEAFSVNKITSVTIPNSVVSIGAGAFGANQLTSVIIGNSVTSIGVAAFKGSADYPFTFNHITSVVIPNSVTSIGSEAFAYNQLTSVTIGNSVTSIEDYAFLGNNITSVTIPNSVTSIGVAAFAYNQLTSVTIPNSVTSISTGAFAYNQLTSVVISNSVTNIKEDTFRNNQLTSVTIPNSVTSIGYRAFDHNQLTSLVIPGNVLSIVDYAFRSNQLTSLVIPDNVVTIGDHAFEDNKLTSVIIGNGVTNIGSSAFYNNKITSVTIPNNVTSIQNNAFGFQYFSAGNGTVYGPLSGYVKNTYVNNPSSTFDKVKLPNYVDIP